MSLLRDDSGATMVEYGIMVALIAAVCIVLVMTLGQTVSNSSPQSIARSKLR